MRLPFLLNGMPVSALLRSSAFTSLNGDSDRVLVLIQLNGGNDGLNTIIPIDQYDNLANARPNIILPQNSLLEVDATNAFHPAMSGLADLYNNAKVRVVQGVGYPNQNRSHFRSTDIWTTGSAADEFLTTGWLGRYFDRKFPSYPEGYPNGDCPAPFALTIGSQVSSTCQGLQGNFSLAINDPDNLSQLPEGLPGSVDPSSCYAQQLDFVRQTILQSNAYASVITDAADAGNSLANYPNNNGLAEQLRTIARLISGGLETRVYIAAIGGFDTHANQVVEDNPGVGDHASLLTQLSGAIAAFQEDLRQLGLEERVVGMTFSEFGRRIRSNAALGTDHGTAAPLILFGSCVQAGILGDNPEISSDVGVQEGVAMQYDFRSVYGSILMDWFEVEETEVRSLLYQDFQYLPLLQACTSVATNEVGEVDTVQLEVFPNPCQDWLSLAFQTGNERLRISIFDALGSEVRVITDTQFVSGAHQLRIETRELAPGTYFVRLASRQWQKTKRLVKM